MKVLLALLLLPPPPPKPAVRPPAEKFRRARVNLRRRAGGFGDTAPKDDDPDEVESAGAGAAVGGVVPPRELDTGMTGDPMIAPPGDNVPTDDAVVVVVVVALAIIGIGDDPDPEEEDEELPAAGCARCWWGCGDGADVAAPGRLIVEACARAQE